MTNDTDQTAQLVRHVADLQRRLSNLEQLHRDLALSLGVAGGMMGHHAATVAEVLPEPTTDE